MEAANCPKISPFLEKGNCLLCIGLPFALLMFVLVVLNVSYSFSFNLPWTTKPERSRKFSLSN